MFCFGVVFIYPIIFSTRNNGFKSIKTKGFTMVCCDFAGDTTMGQKR